MTKHNWHMMQTGVVAGLVLCGGLNAMFQTRWMLLPIALLIGVYVVSIQAQQRRKRTINRRVDRMAGGSTNKHL